MRNSLKAFCALLLATFFAGCGTTEEKIPETATLTRQQLADKIKGGWAGQTIGCTYGAPTEFHYQGSMMQDYLPLPWKEGCIKWYYDNSPLVYDDIYMDLTFVEVFDRLGIDAPADSLAMAFATASYPLWHANQAARNNILNGIMPPASGHWINNPHADDLDYQIEADYAGLMSPGMPNTASEISDRVGHIMTYGDGWYGGVYVGAMYSLAFISDDVNFIVREALKTIPAESRFHRCMSDVIRWHKEFPDDWRRTWFECDRKWNEDIGCPDGVFAAYNIDAVINSAYIVIGLLYGEGDFYKTIDIATRCGQDSDCNPASAGGILGTMLGYDRIPEYWKKNLYEVEELSFGYMDITLNDAYAMSLDQALQVIERNGGTVQGDTVTIRCQQPEPVVYEKSFEGIWPTEKIRIRQDITENPAVEFEGTGIVIRHPAIQGAKADYVAEVKVLIDGKAADTVRMPVDMQSRRYEMYWNYRLPKGKHRVTFEWLNPEKGVTMRLTEAIIYSDAPAETKHE